jgi:acetyl esterase/lipase
MKLLHGLKLALAMALTSCSGNAGTVSAPATGAAPVATAPKAGTPAGTFQPANGLPPLTAAAPTGGGGGTPAVNQPPARNQADSATLTVKDLQVAGDPTRIVYPTPTLEAGKLYPAIVFAHGHGMDQTQMTERTTLAEAAAKEGWLAASGAFGGRAAWANDGAQKDVGALVQELVAHHQADPKRIYLVGFSMGGGTALLAAENASTLAFRPAAVVSTQGFTDLKAMTTSEAGGGSYAFSINQAYGGLLGDADAQAHSPVDHADRLAGIPVYLEHGEADTAVPFSHSTHMATRLTELGAPPELHTYPGLGHSEETIHVSQIMAFLRGKIAP